jgi:hypothetical protein
MNFFVLTIHSHIEAQISSKKGCGIYTKKNSNFGGYNGFHGLVSNWQCFQRDPHLQLETDSIVKVKS